MSEDRSSPTPSYQDSDFAPITSDDDVNVTDIDSIITPVNILAEIGQQETALEDGENSGRITLREAIRNWVLTEKNVPEDAINRLLTSLRRVDATLPVTAAAFFPMPEMENAEVDGQEGDTIGETAFHKVMSRLNGHDTRLDQISGDVRNMNQKMTVLLNQLQGLDEKLGLFVPTEEQSRLATKRSTYVPHRCSTMEELEEWIQQDPERVSRQCSYPTLRASVRAFIKLCMTRNLAMQFSWTGLGDKRKPRKICFKDCSIHSYMLNVLRHTAYTKATFAEIADSVKIVLAGVKDWDGGRKRPGHRGRESRDNLHRMVQNGDAKSPTSWEEDDSRPRREKRVRTSSNGSQTTPSGDMTKALCWPDHDIKEAMELP